MLGCVVIHRLLSGTLTGTKVAHGDKGRSKVAYLGFWGGALAGATQGSFRTAAWIGPPDNTFNIGPPPPPLLAPPTPTHRAEILQTLSSHQSSEGILQSHCSRITSGGTIFMIFCNPNVHSRGNLQPQRGFPWLHSSHTVSQESCWSNPRHLKISALLFYSARGCHNVLHSKSGAQITLGTCSFHAVRPSTATVTGVFRASGRQSAIKTLADEPLRWALDRFIDFLHSASIDFVRRAACAFARCHFFSRS